MLLDMRTPKQRISADANLLFFQDFSNTLWADVQGHQFPVALNTAPTSWTVSEAGEVVFRIRREGTEYIAIIDPIRRERRFQRLDRFDVYNLLLTKGQFIAAVPGLLLMGRRTDEGFLDWHRVRALDRGVGHLFSMNGDGVLNFTKKGSCKCFRYHTERHNTTAQFDRRLLWNTLFSNSATPSVIPPEPKEYSISTTSLLEKYREFACVANLNDVGVRIFALLNILPQTTIERDCFVMLESLLAMDWELQCSALLNEPFPSLRFLQCCMQKAASDEKKTGKLSQQKLMRWSRRFEAQSGLSERIKTLDNARYQDFFSD